jgi:lipoprotein-anchoring transpeptidase ErfK/SrfK
MRDRRPSTRWSAWIGALGTLAIVVALAAPSATPASASPRSATEREQPARLSATRNLAEAPGTVLSRSVDLRLVVTPGAGGDLAVFDAPGAPGPSQVLPAVNELGSPLVLLAVEQRGDWYRVLLPTRPNGSSAWLPTSVVTPSAPAYEVELSLAALELKVVRIDDGAVVLTSPIGIGKPSSPTPTGLYFVRDHFPTDGAPDHPYGPFAFGLSGHSDAPMPPGVGDRIAIHGTNQPASIGAAMSNGCPHVPNDIALDLIPYLSLGTPVTITA